MAEQFDIYDVEVDFPHNWNEEEFSNFKPVTFFARVRILRCGYSDDFQVKLCEIYCPPSIYKDAGESLDELMSYVHSAFNQKNIEDDYAGVLIEEITPMIARELKKHGYKG